MASGPAYLLTRARRADPALTLSPIPKGRSPVSAMALNGQADALGALNFDDVRAAPSPAPTAADVATYRTFDGQVIEFTGRRDGEKTYVAIAAQRDPKLAAQFPKPAAPDKAATPAPAEQTPADKTVEKLVARAHGLEFEIPAYKYDAIFKKQEDLLEKPPAKKKP
jgi:hypothetical protein